ncbi:MAG: hypothetical protein NVSMB18_10160 [Acetobacteraceae bacterium]
MVQTLIRSKAALAPTAGAYDVKTIADGAVLQDAGIIAEVGTYAGIVMRTSARGLWSHRSDDRFGTTRGAGTRCCDTALDFIDRRRE